MIVDVICKGIVFGIFYKLIVGIFHLYIIVSIFYLDK